MATLKAELRTYILASGPIAALVGTRVRPQKMDQGETMPAIRIATVGGESDDTLAGESGMSHARIQIDAYADTSEGASALAELIRLRLRALRGTLSTIFINGCTALSYQDFEEPKDDAGNHFRYIASRDFRISFTQATS